MTVCAVEISSHNWRSEGRRRCKAKQMNFGNNDIAASLFLKSSDEVVNGKIWKSTNNTLSASNFLLQWPI